MKREISSVITSRSNDLIRKARAARDGRQRELIFIEGVRLCVEATRAGIIIEEVLCTQRFKDNERAAHLLRDLQDAETSISMVSEGVLESISDTQTPQGIVILARRPQCEATALEIKHDQEVLIVVLDRVGNPANAGSILRTAEAAGATGVITTEGTVDLFSPKALRGAMGSSFRLPLWTDAKFSAVRAWCDEQRISFITTDVHAVRLYTEVDWTKPTALVVGAEGSGLAASEILAGDEALRIPMHSPVESLNVGVAAAVMLYEAARQRAG